MSAGVWGARWPRQVAGPQSVQCSTRHMTSTPAVGTLIERNLRVLIADENEAALRKLHAVLDSLGHEVTSYAVSVREASELIAREDPHIAIVVVHSDDEHALALIGEAV